MSEVKKMSNIKIILPNITKLKEVAKKDNLNLKINKDVLQKIRKLILKKD